MISKTQTILRKGVFSMSTQLCIVKALIISFLKFDNNGFYSWALKMVTYSTQQPNIGIEQKYIRGHSSRVVTLFSTFCTVGRMRVFRMRWSSGRQDPKERTPLRRDFTSTTPICQSLVASSTCGVKAVLNLAAWRLNRSWHGTGQAICLRSHFERSTMQCVDIKLTCLD